MNNTQAILARMLHKNAIEIQEMEYQIQYFRQQKSFCDEKGYLESEYQYHNALKYLRGELAKYVEEQKFVKKLLRDLKKPKVVKKHGKGENK